MNWNILISEQQRATLTFALHVLSTQRPLTEEEQSLFDMLTDLPSIPVEYELHDFTA